MKAKNVSYTQAYYLCAVNGKGELKTDAIHGALFAGAVLELIESGYIEYAGDKKEKVVVSKVFDESILHLKPLYDFISSQRKTLERASITDFVFNSKSRCELIATIGSSLLALGYATELSSQGLLKNKARYVPKVDTEKLIVGNIRTEILKDEKMADETISLMALLIHSHAVYDYFSEIESDVLEKRLVEVQDSDAFAITREIFDSIMAAFVWEV